MADWGVLGLCRPFTNKEAFTGQLPGQLYQGITNGYDMICLASLPIKACWGNVAAAAPHLTEGLAVFSECSPLFEPLISAMIKDPLWLEQREVATGQSY